MQSSIIIEFNGICGTNCAQGKSLKVKQRKGFDISFLAFVFAIYYKCMYNITHFSGRVKIKILPRLVTGLWSGN